MKQSADNNKTTAVKKQSGRKYIKPIVITAVILAVVIAAAIIVPNLLSKVTSSTRVVTYNVSEVTYGNISQTVSGSGTVTPVTSETVTSTKGGEVAQGGSVAMVMGKDGFTMGIAVVLITHDINVADQAERKVYVRDGILSDKEGK